MANNENTKKRMLALDGGGVRGILTLAYLEKIERALREEQNDKDLVLADYFDFIGGTSTGAIIAAALAKGDSVATVQNLYRNLANDIFKPRFWRRGLLIPKFGVKALEKALYSHLGSITFSDPSIRTGLMIVLKRWDTNSSWVIHNSRNSPYWKYTKDYLVHEIVRASSAAPSYFKPELIEVKRGQIGAFVDGGVTPHNNPSLLMLLLSQLDGHGLQWDLGSDKLAIVSVGTGSRVEKHNPKSFKSRIAALGGITSLAMMMDGADELNRLMMQMFSDSQKSRLEVINKEQDMGQASNSALTGNLTYLRYNVQLETEWLKQHLDYEITEQEVKKLAKLDSVAGMSRLEEIGRIGAARQFDITQLN